MNRWLERLAVVLGIAGFVMFQLGPDVVPLPVAIVTWGAFGALCIYDAGYRHGQRAAERQSEPSASKLIVKR